jgi:hypothetical protein
VIEHVEDPRGFLECLMQLTKVCGPGIKSLSIHSVEGLALLDEFLCRSMSVLERVAPGWCGRSTRGGRISAR